MVDAAAAKLREEEEDGINEELQKMAVEEVGDVNDNLHNKKMAKRRVVVEVVVVVVDAAAAKLRKETEGEEGADDDNMQKKKVEEEEECADDDKLQKKVWVVEEEEEGADDKTAPFGSVRQDHHCHHRVGQLQQDGQPDHHHHLFSVYIYIYKTERCVCLSVCLFVCLSPFSSQTTGRTWTKLGMDLPLDHGNVLHILFWGYPHQRGYNFGKTQNVGNFPLLLRIK